MKTIISLIRLSILVALFQSCEKEINFNADLIEPKMVINGFIQQDSLISIRIGTSKAIPGVEKTNLWISDAIVKLFVDGEETEILSTYDIKDLFTNYNPYSPQDIKDFNQITKGYHSQITKAQAGKTYKLVVTHPNYRTVTCETSIPTPITIESIDTINKIDVSNVYSNSQLQFKTKFKDPSGEKNYYRLVYKKLTGTASNKYNQYADTSNMINVYIENIGSYIYSEDPILNPSDEDANDYLFGSPGNAYNIFTDNLIDGKEYEISFIDQNYGSPSFAPDTTIGEFKIFNIELQSITREAYLYMMSVNAHNFYNSDFFSEPVQVFTNIENGIGIFAGFSYSSKSISIGQYPKRGINYLFQNNNSSFYLYD
jgi:hypothetical protein